MTYSAYTKTKENIFGHLVFQFSDSITPAPVLFALPGFGQRGNGKLPDLMKLFSDGIPELINNGQYKRTDFTIIVPQTGSKFFSPDSLKAFVSYCVTQYNIDESMMYCTGLSGGAISIYQYLAKGYDQFAAVVPIAGSGVPRNAAKNDTPLWAVHGDADNTVPSSGSVLFVQAYNKVHEYKALCTLYPNVGHDSWTRTYNMTGGINIYSWLLKHTR